MEETKRKVRLGQVVSDRMDKTVVVAVESPKRHPLYKKTIKRVLKYKAHDEKNECRVGDKVRIIETRPLSREKHWRVAEIITKGEVVEISPEEITREDLAKVIPEKKVEKEVAEAEPEEETKEEIKEEPKKEEAKEKTKEETKEKAKKEETKEKTKEKSKKKEETKKKAKEEPKD
jgi:small subunit ribosomal protein S17